jgi:Mce-associated membrane protein
MTVHTEIAEQAEPDTTSRATTVLRAALRAARNRLPVLLVALAVVLAGLGTWFAFEAKALRSFDGADNRAQLDATATADVDSAVSSSLNKIFSYSYQHTEITEQAAAQVLRGPALDTYHQLFAQVRDQAPKQKLVLTTRVVNSAVQSLTGDHARLLVFLDQSATRADTNSTSAAASQLSVTAERHSGTWLLTALNPR